jgi:hypothetical protein
MKHPGGRPTKPAEERAESHIHIRTESRRKAGYVKAAQSRGMKLSAWALEAMDAATHQD